MFLKTFIEEECAVSKKLGGSQLQVLQLQLYEILTEHIFHYCTWDLFEPSTNIDSNIVEKLLEEPKATTKAFVDNNNNYPMIKSGPSIEEEPKAKSNPVPNLSSTNARSDKLLIFYR